MKKVKNTIVALVVLMSLLLFGGLIKYNIELNQFKQEISLLPKVENRPTSNETEVHIIGTMHFDTNSFKRLDLYKKIDSISPSFILFESDSSTVERILNNGDYFFQVMRGYQSKKDVEKPVTLAYIENNLNCIVLPYEWELRDQFHHKHNLRSTDSLVKQRQYYKYTKLNEIVKGHKDLSEFLDFAQINEDYWDIRNKAMAQNIIKRIRSNPNKIIVVLTGYYHRYYLIDELKNYEDELEFSIKGI